MDFEGVAPGRHFSQRIEREGNSTLMLRRSLILLFLGMTSIIGGRASVATVEEKSCSQHPQLIGKCFVVHGRLSVYNGAPALRLWKIGTRRMLGISEQRFGVAGYRNLPQDIERQVSQDVAIFGDFLVCPFTRERPAEMQLVCIESGKNLVVRKRR